MMNSNRKSIIKGNKIIKWTRDEFEDVVSILLCTKSVHEPLKNTVMKVILNLGAVSEHHTRYV